MSAAHAKPLSRRQLRQRARITKWTVGSIATILLAGAVTCSLSLPGTPTAIGVPTRSPGTVSRSVDETAANRSAIRADLFADNTAAVNVDATGTWKLADDHIDVDHLTTPKPQSDPTAATDTATSQTRASMQTITLLNATTMPTGDRTSHPANTGDSGNAYPWGQCTWWAYVRRHQLGLPVGSYFGDAANWANSAAALGYTTTHTPTVGAVIVFAPGQEGASATYGHVAIVEQTHGDGSITISESNAQGLGVISNRIIPNADLYTYIL